MIQIGKTTIYTKSESSEQFLKENTFIVYNGKLQGFTFFCKEPAVGYIFFPVATSKKFFSSLDLSGLGIKGFT